MRVAQYPPTVVWFRPRHLPKRRVNRLRSESREARHLGANSPPCKRADVLLLRIFL